MVMGSSQGELAVASSLSLVRLVRPMQRPIDDEDAATADGLQSFGAEAIGDGEDALHVDRVEPVGAARRGGSMRSRPIEIYDLPVSGNGSVPAKLARQGRRERAGRRCFTMHHVGLRGRPPESPRPPKQLASVGVG